MILNPEYVKISKTNTKRTNNPINKLSNELNMSKEVQMSNKHMKKCSTPLAIKEMQMQITLRFHFTPVRKATIQKTNNHKYW
jgi:hypothetical protein